MRFLILSRSQRNVWLRFRRCSSTSKIIATGVWDVEATKDFADITIAFATTFEINGNQRHAGFDRDNATFLSLGAPNRAYALRKYQELILKQK